MKEFRDRVLIPTLVPLAALAIIVVVVLNVSRVLLALEERSGPNTVTALAVILSSGILFGFTYFSSRGEEQSTASVSLMSVAGIMVVMAGFFGAEAMHEDEQEKKAEAAKKLAEESKPDLTVEAFDIGLRRRSSRSAPGRCGSSMITTGAIAHTLVLEGVAGGKKLSTPSGGSKDTGTFDVQAGTYTYFCDIAGHRQGGMEGKLIVDPSAPAPGSGAGGGAAGAPAAGAPAAGAPAAAAPAAAAPAASGPLTIEGGDLFFKPKEVTAKAGSVSDHLQERRGDPAQPGDRGGPELQEARRRPGPERHRHPAGQTGDVHPLLRHRRPSTSGHGGEAHCLLGGRGLRSKPGAPVRP